MKVIELDPGKRVLRQVTDGPEEWIGTKVSFEIKQDGHYTIVLFKYQAGRNRWSSCTTAAPGGEPS